MSCGGDIFVLILRGNCRVVSKQWSEAGGVYAFCWCDERCVRRR